MIASECVGEGDCVREGNELKLKERMGGRMVQTPVRMVVRECGVEDKPSL